MSMRYTTELGSVVVDTKVIAQMAGLSAVELYGIVGMAMVSLKDGIVKMLSRSALTKGVNVIVEENGKFNQYGEIQTGNIFWHESKADQCFCGRRPS